MSLQVEKLEKNMAKLTIEVSAEDLEKAMQAAYQKAKGRITLPGSVSYTHLDVYKRQYIKRVEGLAAGMILCMIIFYKNQKNRPYRRTFLDLFREFDLHSARGRWYLKLTFIVSSAMLFMNLLGLPRAMWAGIACMSVCLPFTKDRCL